MSTHQLHAARGMHAIRCSMRRLARTAVAAMSVSLAAAHAYAPALAAQSTTPTAWGNAPDLTGALTGMQASWLGAWSPLRPIVDIPRGLLRAPLAPGVLTSPPPLSGAFVVAGAPGALARDLVPSRPGDAASFSDLRVRLSSERGDYRRPLDVSDSRVTQVSGLGWSPVGARGVAIGRFVVDREQNDVSSFAERVAPYRSSPFVATDSVMPPMQRTRARLEGALGLRLGEFGVGVSAGLDTREHNSVDFPLRRSGRATTPAVVLGVERVLPWYRVRIGAYYRWSEPNETNVLNPSPLPTVIYAIRGYDEPLGIPVSGTSSVFVRHDRRATAVGGTAEATVLSTRVVLTHEQGDHADDQYRTVASAVRPTERWRANGTETRVQLQRLFGPRLRTTVVGVHQTLNGEAVRSDLTGLAFDGNDTRSAVEGDVRLSVSDAWSAAVLGGVSRTTSVRTDFVTSIASRVEAAVPFVGGEVARRFGGGLALAVGGSVASTSPNGALPGANRGPNYGRLIAPALAYDAAEATAVAGWLTATVPFRGRTLMAGVRSESTSPSSVVTARLQPGGSRDGWSVVVGIR